MTKKHNSRHGTPAPKPVVIDPNLEAAKKLPLFGPGLVIKIPLQLWPAYQQLHHLTIPGGYNEAFNILRVKRMPPALNSSEDK